MNFYKQGMPPMYNEYAMGGQVAIKTPRRIGLMPVPNKPLELMKKGGRVLGRDIGNIDTVPAVLAVNEIVIPRRISTTKKFKNYLTKNYNYNQKLGKFK